jgi:hypothetical protein
MPDIVGPAREREIARLEGQLKEARQALTEIRDHWQTASLSWTRDRAQRALDQLETKP